MQNKFVLTITIVMLFLLCIYVQPASAQDKTSKSEVGVQFSSLSITDTLSGFADSVSGIVIPERKFSYPGVGGRFTYNVTDNFALEAEANFFLREDKRGTSRFVGGYPAQGLFGVKIGKHFNKVGVFGKARPGFVSFSRTIASGLGGSGNLFSRRTHFATDVGGVIEFYPSRRIVTRFDIGDTIIRYGDELLPGTTIPFKGDVSHNLQVSGGIGFRF